MFVDTARVTVQAGKGGDGAMSFRHEIYVAKGGPDGGNGGRGGDVIFKATENLNTLLDFRYKPELKAKDGGNGSKRDRAGKSGEDLIVKVPIGTIVLRDGKEIADLIENNQEVIIAKGGDGGFGNAHFKSSTRQTPRIAERGESGEKFEAELELKLLADVGLIGLPNAGKSTFLSVVSNAKPEIADYPFTTLSPNLGVADIDESSLLIADIPGLIEGASEGKGLGDAFLRHVERNSVLLHLIDAYTDDIVTSYKTIRNELEKYNPELIERPEIVALTKCEGLDQDIIKMQVDELKENSDIKKVHTISSASHQGIKELLRDLVKLVIVARKETKNKELEKQEEIPVLTISSKEQSEGWIVDKVQSESEIPFFVVSGEKIEKFARRTNFNQYEAVNRLRDIMKKIGIVHELRRQGAENESIIRIDGNEFTLIEQ